MEKKRVGLQGAVVKDFESGLESEGNWSVEELTVAVILVENGGCLMERRGE